MTLLDSLVNGRIHTQLLPEVVGVEDQNIECAPHICESADGSSSVLEIEAGQDVQDALTSRHHEISVREEQGFAVCQFIGMGLVPGCAYVILMFTLCGIL